jgi:hypothetical protein
VRISSEFQHNLMLANELESARSAELRRFFIRSQRLAADWKQHEQAKSDSIQNRYYCNRNLLGFAGHEYKSKAGGPFGPRAERNRQ